MSNWSDTAWNDVMPIYKKTIEHPFLTELADGILPLPKFRHYIQQDMLYLRNYGELLAVLSSKLEKQSDKELFKRFADDSVACEKALHEVFVKEFDIPKQEIKSVACKMYTDFLIESVNNKPLEIGLAAIMPCFKVYNEVGKYIYANHKAEKNPYQMWINAYANDAFTGDVIKYSAVADSYAEKTDAKTIELMTEAYVEATRLEFIFWDTAYNLKMQ